MGTLSQKASTAEFHPYEVPGVRIMDRMWKGDAQGGRDMGFSVWGQRWFAQMSILEGAVNAFNAVRTGSWVWRLTPVIPALGG